MDGASSLLKSLIRNSIQVTNEQRIRLEELIAKDFPTKHAKEYLDVFLEFNKEFLTIFRTKEKEFSSLKTEKDFDTFRGKMLTYLRLVGELNYIIWVIERSEREHVNESTVLLLAHFTREFNKDSKFFVIPTDEYNYIYHNLGYILEKISVQLPQTKTLLEKLPKTLTRLSFPDIFKENLIANCELAHEVGHFINDIEGITKIISKEAKITKGELQTWLNKGLEGESTTVLQIKNQKYQNITYSIDHWIMELFCDLIALRLTGPAFIFSLSDLLLTKQYPEEPTIKYPPATLRLGLLLEEFDEINYLVSLAKEDKDLMNDLIEKIRNHINAAPKRVGEDKFSGEEILHAAIDSVKSLIKNSAKEATKKFQYEPKDFREQVFPLVEKLKQYVPPCEIKRGIPANLVSIINAGMIFRLIWGNFPPPIKIESDDDKSQVVEIINSQVTKAIELSEILRQLQKGVDTK